MTPALIKRVESATEGDRELDGDICVALDGGGEIVWKQANYTMEMHPARKIARANYVGGFAFEYVPRYTSSLDAAVSLCERVLPGVSRNSGTTIGGGFYAEIETANRFAKHPQISCPPPIRVQHVTEPLALVLAVLRAVTP